MSALKSEKCMLYINFFFRFYVEHRLCKTIYLSLCIYFLSFPFLIVSFYVSVR